MILFFEIIYRISRSYLLRVLLFLTLPFLFLGCSPVLNPMNAGKDCVELPALSSDSRISVFLNLHETLGSKLELGIGGVEVLVGAEWVPLMSSARIIKTGTGGSGQFFLGSRKVPAGSYSAVRLHLNYASNSGGNEKLDFVIDQPVIELKVKTPIYLSGQSNRIIFINWNVDKTLDDTFFKSNAFTADNDQGIVVSSSLIYVSCPDIDTVYVVWAANNRIVGSISIPGKPAYVHADNVNKILYILSADSSIINVVHMVSKVIKDRIKIPFVVDPLLMEIDPGFQNAYILGRRGTLVKINLQNGNMTARVKIGQKPNYITYLSDSEKLAVSSTLDNNVYFVDPDKLDIMESIHVEGHPSGLAVLNDMLYIAENNLDYVSIYDLNQRKTIRRVPVGRFPGRIVGDQDQVFVANTASDSLSLIKGTQSHVSKKIQVGRGPFEMVVADFQRYLYVGKGDCSGSLSVVDLSLNQVVAEIELGAKPVGIAVIQ